ncbi:MULTISPECIES: DUF7344 domain-containing protein [Natrialbaceae]|uniref:DUF7344 domain-containing protein n=1 Tax=Natrialbaceae TaxID=1644061 RepID=UPI00207CCE53|nr:hypothetical protein [Natronococcus sp. CG52]
MENKELPQDVVYRLLSHVYRQALLGCLDQHDVPLAVADAAEEVARDCKSEPISEIPEAEVKKIYLALTHSHVPQLVEENVITYDQEQNLIALTERGKHLVTVQKHLDALYFD